MTPTPSKYAHLSTLDPNFLAIKDEMDAGSAQLLSLPLDQVRAVLLQPQLPDDVPTDLDISDAKVPVRDGTEVGIRIYKARDVREQALMFYSIHGGGWVVGSHEMEETLNRNVAAKTGAVVVSVDYRLAPEFKYPYAVNDCFDVLKWCKKHAHDIGINLERIVVGGGSAGGNLAAVMAQKCRDEGVSGILGQVLNIPVTCHPHLFPKDKYEFTSWEQNKDAAQLPAETMMWFWDSYFPNPTPDAAASPLLAKSFEGLPPALVQVAGFDVLRDEGLAYAEALKKAGVPVQLGIYPGLPHGFGNLVALKDAVNKYTMAVVDWITSNF